MNITIYTPKNKTHAIEAARQYRAPLSFPEEYAFQKALDLDDELIDYLFYRHGASHLDRVDDDCEDEDVVEATIRSPYDDGYSYTGKYKTRILGNRYELEDGRVFVAKLSGFEELTA